MTSEELERLRLYGACPECGTPRDARRMAEGCAHDEICFELVQPCGHPLGD